jgi:hypothetical protein
MALPDSGLESLEGLVWSGRIGAYFLSQQSQK